MKELFRNFSNPLKDNRLVYAGIEGGPKAGEVSPEQAAMEQEATKLVAEYKKILDEGGPKNLMDHMTEEGHPTPVQAATGSPGFTYEGYYAKTVLLKEHGNDKAQMISDAVDKARGIEAPQEGPTGKEEPEEMAKKTEEAGGKLVLEKGSFFGELFNTKAMASLKATYEKGGENQAILNQIADHLFQEATEIGTEAFMEKYKVTPITSGSITESDLVLAVLSQLNDSTNEQRIAARFAVHENTQRLRAARIAKAGAEVAAAEPPEYE